MNISIPKSNQNPTPDLNPRCYTCLSSGRDLKPMKTEEKIILGMLCPEMFFHNKGNVQYLYLMCWECKYMIVKIKRFQARVSNAQAQMKLKLQGVKSIVDSISDLKITGILMIDVPPQVPTDQNQLPLNEIPQPLSPILTSVKVDPEIIESRIEQEETIGNDYNELITPIKIKQPSSDDSTDTASESETNDDPLMTPGTVDVPPQKATKHAFVSPNHLALRGYKEAVNVTSGLPNLVTVENVPILVKKKVLVPTLQKTKDGITITFKDNDGASNVANEDTGGDPNRIKRKVAPTCPKREEPVLKRPILLTCPNPPKEPECEQRAGMDDYEEDEVKCSILNETELKTYRDKKRSRRGYKAHPYKCERCIQTFPDKKFLDQHIKKHDKMQANISMEIRENIVALHKNGLNISQISNETGISRHSVSRWVKRFEEERSLNSRMRPGRPPLINPTQRRSMAKECETNVFISPKTFADQFDTSVSTVRRALNREGLRYNNRKSAKRRHKCKLFLNMIPNYDESCDLYDFFIK